MPYSSPCFDMTYSCDNSENSLGRYRLDYKTLKYIMINGNQQKSIYSQLFSGYYIFKIPKIKKHHSLIKVISTFTG